MGYLSRKQKRLADERQRYKEERDAERAFLSALVQDQASQVREKQGPTTHGDFNDTMSVTLRPPLPEIVRRVLARCRLSYLSTVDMQSNSSHLSLMRFTYLPEEEMIVMSTNVRTKKYDMLEQQSEVALLIHDFSETSPVEAGEGASASSRLTGEYSITLNGTCSVVKDVVLAEKYRAAHLKNNPDYPQFIIGKDIAMLRVDVAFARICNINDEVVKWNVVSGSSAKE